MAPLSKPGLPEEVARNLPISDASRPCWRVTSGNAFFGIAKVTSADIALRPDGGPQSAYTSSRQRTGAGLLQRFRKQWLRAGHCGSRRSRSWHLPRRSWPRKDWERLRGRSAPAAPGSPVTGRTDQ